MAAEVRIVFMKEALGANDDKVAKANSGWFWNDDLIGNMT